MLARTHLIQLQKALYDKLKAQTRHYLGRLSPELKHYLKEYQETLKNYEGLTSNRQLLIDLIKCQVALCGDFHTLPQSQRTVLRFLRSTHRILKRQKRTIVLALEMFSPQDQKFLNSYLSGRLSEKSLISKTRFRKRWGFQWENYVPLLRFAKENQLKILGLYPNVPLPLKERDKFAANIIAQTTQLKPDALIFVLIGDLHLGENHLPQKLTAALKQKKIKRELIVIHQNNEKFFWSLTKQGLENFVEVIKVKSGVYCVMNTPPWVKLQSHLKWIETVAEGAAPKGYVRDYARAIDTLDHSYEIVEAIRILKEFLEIQDPIDDDFHIRGPLDLSFLQSHAEKKIFSKSELRILTGAIREFESQFFPRSNDLFLTNLAMNHLTSQTAYFLHSKLSGFRGVFEKPNRDFYIFLWIEALAYLSSKLVNPKRKVPSELELRQFLRLAKNKTKIMEPGVKAIELVLKHFEKEKRMRANSKTRLSFKIAKSGSLKWILEHYKATKLLGAILGDALHAGLYEGRISKDEIRELFYCPFTPFHAPKSKYIKWIQRLDKYQYRNLVRSGK